MENCRPVKTRTQIIDKNFVSEKVLLILNSVPSGWVPWVTCWSEFYSSFLRIWQHAKETKIVDLIFENEKSLNWICILFKWARPPFPYKGLIIGHMLVVCPIDDHQKNPKMFIKYVFEQLWPQSWPHYHSNSSCQVFSIFPNLIQSPPVWLFDSLHNFDFWYFDTWYITWTTLARSRAIFSLCTKTKSWTNKTFLLKRGTKIYNWFSN